MDVFDFDKLFDKAREEDLKAYMSKGIFYNYRIEDDLCYVNGLDKDVVKMYFLYAITNAMERNWDGRRILERLEDVCKHFDLDYDELYQEAYHHKNTMKYKAKKER